MQINPQCALSHSKLEHYLRTDGGWIGFMRQEAVQTHCLRTLAVCGRRHITHSSGSSASTHTLIAKKTEREPIQQCKVENATETSSQTCII
jgi:hypothetical protein